MPKLSMLLGADVFSRSDGSFAGAVSDVYFDGNCRKIVYFVLGGEGGELLLSPSDADAVRDAVVTEDALPFTAPGDVDLSPLVPSLIGKRVYTSGGSRRGEVRDVIFSGGGKVNAIVTDEAEFVPSAFRAFGDILVLKEGAQKRKRNKRPSFPKAKTDYPVRALAPSSDIRPAEAEPEVSVPLAAPSVAVRGEEEFTPYRVIADYNFLLGRTLADDLVAYSGETLAKRGEHITAELVELARRQGKLMDLTLSSR